MSPPIENSWFTRQTTRYDMKDIYKLVKPTYNTMQYGFRSISYQGATIWNELPIEIKKIDDFVVLPRKL